MLIADGSPPWSRRLDWLCAGTPLSVQILARAACPLPEPEPSEPAAAALARVLQALAGHRALVHLASPAASFGAERIALASGVRLMSCATAEDQACWQAALDLGCQVWGVRGTLRRLSPEGDPEAVLADLAWGRFVCEEGALPLRIAEDRSGIRVEADEDLETEVLVRQGYCAAILRGRRLEWRDRGGEGLVRLVIKGARGRCWTQPRFTAPSAPHGRT